MPPILILKKPILDPSDIVLEKISMVNIKKNLTTNAMEIMFIKADGSTRVMKCVGATTTTLVGPEDHPLNKPLSEEIETPTNGISNFQTVSFQTVSYRRRKSTNSTKYLKVLDIEVKPNEKPKFKLISVDRIVYADIIPDDVAKQIYPKFKPNQATEETP